MRKRAAGAVHLATVVALATGVASAAPGSAAADSSPPRVKALPSIAATRAPVRLRVLADDDSGEFLLGASVFRGNEHLFVVRSNWIRVVQRPLYYFVQFSTPRLARGIYRFCVKAADRAGNRSGISCSSLRVG